VDSEKSEFESVFRFDDDFRIQIHKETELNEFFAFVIRYAVPVQNVCVAHEFVIKNKGDAMFCTETECLTTMANRLN
jgi:hypothetical protein